MIMMHHLPSNALSRASANRAVFCGCGESFADHSAFKEHSLLDHQGQHIDGSSHFLSKFTLVVLPARTQQTKMYHQDVSLKDFCAEDDSYVHSKRKAKQQQESTFEPRQQQTEVNRLSNKYEEVSLEQLALIRNEDRPHKYSYYCGNCRQRNFSNATEFIVHLRDICPVIHKRSTHHLTFLDYDHEIQEYINKTHEPKQRAKKSTLRTFLKEILGTNVGHCDLPFFCWPCRQQFIDLRAFWVHIARIHQEQIDQGSSHVILRFRDRFSMSLTEKIEWIHDEETALCPCDPSKKMTVANLIKHLRQMHHGVSPIYEKELMAEVNNGQQDSFIHQNLAIKSIQNKSSQTDEQQSLEDDNKNNESIEEQAHQILHSSSSDEITEDIANLRLVRNPAVSTINLQCGNCQKKDFKDVVSFIIHLKNICTRNHPKSSHFLIKRNFNKEIEDYQQKKKHGNTSQNRDKVHQAILRTMNIAFDHSDLSLECGVCRQIFEPHSYYLHNIARHSEIIDRSSSHIILRFHWRKRSHLYVSDRVPWIHQEETYFCPCKPEKKMTMERLIKHMREVHMGISPIYDIPVDNSNINPHIHRSKIYKNVQVQHRKAAEQKILIKDEKIETKKQHSFFHQNCFHVAQNDATLLRLFRSPEGNNHYNFYCANCRKHDFRESAQFITHLRDVCRENHPKSSHFLVAKDIKKEIEDYPRKKDHRLSKINELSQRHTEFIYSFLGSTYDHSDLTFECQPCRQIFKEGGHYLSHTQYRHQDMIYSTSSHIVLRFPSIQSNRKMHVYISDRVSWTNEDTRYYCPCKVDKQMTMKDLIKHVREVHMGISPIYELSVSDSSKNSQDESADSSQTSENDQASSTASEDQQIIEGSEQIEGTQIKQAQVFSSSHAIHEENDIGDMKLVRSPESDTKYTFLCGNCWKHDFNNPDQFITHLKNICKCNHRKSTHLLVEKDIRKEVEDYRKKKDHATAAIKGISKRYANFITSFLGATYDHSDLTIECYPCRQIFETERGYYTHIRSKHSGKLHSNSSHIILRFPSAGQGKKFIYISDRIPWINEDAIYYCPCEPSNKLTMEHLIKHVRQIHHGVSPVYQLEQGILHTSIDQQDNVSNEDLQCESFNGQTTNKIQSQYDSKGPQINWKYKTVENSIPRQQLSYNHSAPQEEVTNNRLLLNTLYHGKGVYRYNCGVCRKNNIKNPTDFITHIENSCSDSHPKSSRFLASIDFKKEIQNYLMKKDHSTATITDDKKYVNFITSFLGNTYDHSDLIFECYPCRQIFQSGPAYYNHVILKHPLAFDSKSSHIILRFPSKNIRKNVYISDRVPWVNNDERYYCPCEPNKNVTMTNLIRHVKEVHKGISPQYQM